MSKAHILKILAGGPEKGVKVAHLKIEIGTVTGARVGDADFEAAAKELVQDGHCKWTEDEFTKDRMLAITKAGRAIARKKL